jgi:hypothetical protein
MSSVSDAYYNAMAKSFFASLEYELIVHCSRMIKTKAHQAIFTRIESGYTPCRRHSGLNYLSPINFEGNTNTKNATISPRTRVTQRVLRIFGQFAHPSRARGAPSTDPPGGYPTSLIINPLHQEAKNCHGNESSPSPNC